MRRARIGVRVHRDGVNAEAPRGARDAAGDLAAVRDEQPGEHGYFFGGPGRRALFEERRDALAAFGRHAGIRDAFRGRRQQHVVHGRFDDVGQQALRGGQRRGTRREQRC